MDRIREILDRMKDENSQALGRLRAEMNAGFEDQKRATGKLQGNVGTMQEAMQAMQAAMVVMQGTMATMQGTMATMQGTMATMQGTMATMQETMVDQDRAISRQQHLLDQGLAEMDDRQRRHSENVGTVIFTYVEDLNSVKAAMRHLEQEKTSILGRLDALEGKQAS